MVPSMISFLSALSSAASMAPSSKSMPWLVRPVRKVAFKESCVPAVILELLRAGWKGVKLEVFLVELRLPRADESGCSVEALVRTGLTKCTALS